MPPTQGLSGCSPKISVSTGDRTTQTGVVAEETVDPAALLGRVVKAQKKINRARRNLDRAVTEARGAGLSWVQIAEVLGVSRQAVWERFAKRGVGR